MTLSDRGVLENARRAADTDASVSAVLVVGVAPEWSFCSAPGGLARGD